ncbi:hypothetical protein HJC99_03990 [Candidatus Saccharibacteria bacterium]|nr:hypothetical protein [Candidatus Saccharibacteria bacterium]
MFTHKEYVGAFTAAGLVTHFMPTGINPNGRGIFIGTDENVYMNWEHDPDQR